MKYAFLTIVGLSAILGAAQAQQKGDPKATEVWTPVPAKVDPGSATKAPSDAIVLFDGSNLNQWESAKGGAPAEWKVADNAFTVKPGSGDIRTKEKFGDCQLHIEWRTPSVVQGEGQGRGNSGIFFMERYELQVLDNYDNVTYSNGQAGSIYKQGIPLVNVCRKPGEWQTYDVIFTAPKFNADGSLASAARITVLQNGVLVQNNFELKGQTEYIGKPTYKQHGPGSIQLQDHGNEGGFRNIWIRKL
ncbi:3-keto-disaccharide hydrolase [Flavihumibacter petaseus]|uniref:3-keto-alpha-glucoside-1,2-lyase/3-keto-2-hydroxy-glucal hydratase domain-containing protein n=1 Tax=Flavihumibacter petaseus NBRC 106054 TaxID=1220578 RepID=A0A0E9MWH8_9BACT|nr:DUF1080 domain-containing protein [Flavihumibacter petaseus]GAO41796.1 hypothetical protein FPE01S_01_08100 [Flavihumibacter petaseus NBRC 106054]